MDWIVTLTPSAEHGALDLLSAPPQRATVVELRLDLFPDLNVRNAVNSCPLPVLATYRSQAEGGQGSSDPEIRAAKLGAARDGGALLVDLEYQRDLGLITQLAMDPSQLVISWHDAQGTPADLSQLVREMTGVNARWIKVIPTATCLADLAPILDLHQRWNACHRPNRRLICFAMGKIGLPTRYLAPVFGPSLSYCAWPGLAPGAPGQLTAGAIEAIVGHLNGAPQLLFGVVGGDVSRSLSPTMHSAAYRCQELHHLFIPVSVPSADELPLVFGAGGLNLFDRLGIRVGGWAVTAPYKLEAVAHATHCAPRVQRARSANTLLFRGQQVVAENTDADGVVGALVAHGCDLAGKLAVVYGPGGAGRGAAVGLHLAGADVVLCGRNPESTCQVAREIGVRWTDRLAAVPEAHVLVNASLLGSQPEDPSPFPAALVKRAEAVVDMVYAATRTPLVSQACAANVTAIEGRMVLAYQGFAQFAAMTGVIPPRDEMLQAVGSLEGP